MRLKMLLKKVSDYYLLASERHKKWGHRHALIQFFEMVLTYLITGISPGYYLQAKMGDKSYSYIFGFMNNKTYVKAVYKVNNRLFQKTSMNKMIEKAIFTSYNLPTPQLLGFFHQFRGRDAKGNPLCTTEDFLKFIKNCDKNKICIKPAESFGGIGVRIVDIKMEGDNLYFFDNYNKKTTEIIEYIKDYLQNNPAAMQSGIIIEDYLIQNSSFAKYNKSSVNTVRVMVNLHAESEAHVFGAFLRVGRANSVVDNGTSGGIMVGVNPKTGELGYGSFSSLSNNRFDSHPDSKIRFKGDILPFWNEIKSLSTHVVKLFPDIYYAGLDIAVSDEGPVVIEMNVQPDYVDFALIEVPTKFVFNAGILK